MTVRRSILLLLLFVPGWGTMPRRDILGDQPRFALTPVQLRSHGGGARLGGLTFLTGYRLTSPDSAFGGFSSLMVDHHQRSGDRFTLLSDGGTIVRFRLDAQGRVSDRHFGDLPGGPGTGWQKIDRDSESMTRDPATGKIWVGFERANAIWRFAPDLARAERWSAPSVMHDWPKNGGPEAMVRLSSGDFIVFSEEEKGQANRGRATIRFAGDPTMLPGRATVFTYLPPIGFEPTDAAELPDGRLALLNRRFDWWAGFTAVLTVVDPTRIRAGATLRGQEIARFAADVLHDNFEGLAVTREGKDTIIWIISDDNQSSFQQTLLLKFRLDPATAPSPSRISTR